MLAVTNVRLIDGSGAPARDNCAVLIENGLISAVGPSLPVPACCDIINASGLTAIPGLIDAHTHFSGSSLLSRPPLGAREETYDYAEAREGFLRCGVTAARTCGDICPDILEFSALSFGAQTVSPRVSACGRMFQPYGGHPCYTVFGSSERIEKQACVITDSADISDSVKRLKNSGAQFIKAFYAHLNKMAYPAPSVRMPKKTLALIGEAAAREGLPLAVHVDDFEEFSDAVDCGARSVEHLLGAGAVPEEIPEPLVKKAAAAGVFAVPTLVSIKGCSLPGAEPVWPQLSRAVKRLHEAGVPIAAGCDSGIPFVPFGSSLQSELELLVSCGLSPMEALLSATSVNARLLGLDDAGVIAPGKRADIVLLGADPLESISAVRRVERVLLAGKTVFERVS